MLFLRKYSAVFCVLLAMLSTPCFLHGQSGSANGSEPQLPTSQRPTTPPIQLSFFGADFLLDGLIWPGTDGLGRVATLGGLRIWDSKVKWGQINTAQDFYDWGQMDAWIAMAQSENLDVEYTFGDTPDWDGTIPPPPVKCVKPSDYGCSAPNDVNTDGTGTDAAFSNFVTALVTRYKGQIAYYELWNEPDCTCYFAGTQAQLVRMSTDAAAIIRSIDPNARILSPSGHVWSLSNWFDGFLAAGGGPTFDIISMHMRGSNATNSTPETFLSTYASIEADIVKNKLTSKPLWDTEHGIRRNQGLNDPDELAGYAAREVILRAGVGLPRQYMYAWDDTAPIGFQANQAGTAWNTVAGWLIGHSISPCAASSSVATVYTCNTDNGQIVWDTKQTCSSGVCTKSSYAFPTIYKFQTDISGRKTRLSGKTVGIGYKPIFLTTK